MGLLQDKLSKFRLPQLYMEQGVYPYFREIDSHQDTEAFIDLLPGCSAIRQDSHLYGQLCDTLIQIATLVPVGMLECRPDREAAQLCHHEINRINQSY